MGRPSTYRSNAFSGKVFLQGKRAWASNARPYKRFSTVRIFLYCTVLRLFSPLM